MKALKFSHDIATDIKEGKRSTTWRMYDDKDTHVGDRLELVDKIDPRDPSTWEHFAIATITQIVEKRLGSVEASDYELETDQMSPEDLLLTFQKYYGPQVTFDTPLRIMTFSVNAEPKTADSDTQSLSDVKEAKLYADGGSRGNPGPSASGYALFTMDGEEFFRKGIYLGVTTNNQAEYQALKFGLEEAKKRGIREVHVYMDSLLVVNQMLGKFKVKNRDLWPIHDAIKSLVPSFAHVYFTHVPRELNKIADAAVNQALDEAEDRQADREPQEML